jgi:hypothetical protein
MLKGNPEEFDLAAKVEQVIARLTDWGVEGILPPDQRTEHRFEYPVLAWPAKVKSFNLDKIPAAGGTLQGIKGQYLIFSEGVINLRKYTGYKVEILAG